MQSAKLYKLLMNAMMNEHAKTDRTQESDRVLEKSEHQTYDVVYLNL